MRRIACAAVATVVTFGAPSVLAGGSASHALSGEDALDLLIAGNTRWVENRSTFRNITPQRIAETATNGQFPFATIISCSDSRVPVELAFDRGVGDVFVIRVAGNVCDSDEIGSIEYGVDHLGTPLMVVMGHSGCGAVTAVAQGAEVHGSIPGLVDNIIPAVERTRAEHPELSGAAFVEKAVEANVFQSVQDLITGSPAVRQRVADGRVIVVGAVYDLHTGAVEFLGEHPEQVALISGHKGQQHADAQPAEGGQSH